MHGVARCGGRSSRAYGCGAGVRGRGPVLCGPQAAHRLSPRTTADAPTTTPASFLGPKPPRRGWGARSRMRAAAKARGALGCALSLGAAACAAALGTAAGAGPSPCRGHAAAAAAARPAAQRRVGAGEPTPRMLLEVWFPGWGAGGAAASQQEGVVGAATGRRGRRRRGPPPPLARGGWDSSGRSAAGRTGSGRSAGRRVVGSGGAPVSQGSSKRPLARAVGPLHAVLGGAHAGPPRRRLRRRRRRSQRGGDVRAVGQVSTA